MAEVTGNSSSWMHITAQQKYIYIFLIWHFDFSDLSPFTFYLLPFILYLLIYFLPSFDLSTRVEVLV